jgi:hypothetical protein
MQLKDAMLCLNCDEIFEYEVVPFKIGGYRDMALQLTDCPACGSKHSHRLTTWVPTMATVQRLKKGRAAETATALVEGN